MTKKQLIFQYLHLNRKSYLLAIVFIFLVNWLQVEIPRYIQLAIDLIEDGSTQGHNQLKSYVDGGCHVCRHDCGTHLV